MANDTFPQPDALPESARLLAEGTQFGPYRVVRLLGVGGMGQVYEAMHEKLGKRVAIKVIVPEHAQNREVVARFLQEARATARIRHPNVVDVTDVGEVNGVPYLVMEFLEGAPLTKSISPHFSMSTAEAVDLMLPVLGALQAAHEQGIIHRDIKPDNIFLVRERGGVRPKLVDFGISKLLDDGPGGGLTKTSLVVGTPYYMAPEQAQDSKRVDARADVYALGVVLYEMLTGEVPFSGDSLMSILMQIAKGEYPPLRTRRPDVDPGLEAVIATAMAMDVTRRYPSASAFGAALLPFASPAVRAQYAKELATTQPFLPQDAMNATAQFSATAVATPSLAYPGHAPTGHLPAPQTRSSNKALVAFVLVGLGVFSLSCLAFGAYFAMNADEVGSELADAVAEELEPSQAQEPQEPEEAHGAKPGQGAASPSASLDLRFGGECEIALDGNINVGSNDMTNVITVVAGQRVSSLIFSPCGRTGTFELGSIEMAQSGVTPGLAQGMRMWGVIPNLAAEPGQALAGGTLVVTRNDCNTGILEARFENAVFTNMTRTATCTVNGTVRTLGTTQ